MNIKNIQPPDCEPMPAWKDLTEDERRLVTIYRLLVLVVGDAAFAHRLAMSQTDLLPDMTSDAWDLFTEGYEPPEIIDYLESKYS